MKRNTNLVPQGSARLTRLSKTIRTAGMSALGALSLLGAAAQDAIAQTPISTTPIACSPAPCAAPQNWGTRAIEIFPENDMVGLGGYVANADVLIQVIGGTKLKGFARGRLDGDGALEVNHPGGVCWGSANTPDIGPNDVIRVTYDNTANNQTLAASPTSGVIIGAGDELRTINITATPPQLEGNTVVIKGKALLAGTIPFPLARIEVMTRNEAFDAKLGLGGRLDNDRLIASALGNSHRLGREYTGPDRTEPFGIIVADPACRGCFKATFTNLVPYEIQVALAPENRNEAVAWMVDPVATPTNPDPEGIGLTIYGIGETGGASDGFDPPCPPGPGAPTEPSKPTAPVAYDPALLADASIPDPTRLRDAVVFPARDFVNVEGYARDTELQLVVRRRSADNTKDVIVGTTRGKTVTLMEAPNLAFFEVNHVGAYCWSGQTPDIREGDKLDVFPVINGRFDPIVGGQTQTVIGIRVTGPAVVELDANNQPVVVVRGTKPATSPLQQMEHGFVNRNFKDDLASRIGRRDIRATAVGSALPNIPGGTGLLVLDGSDTQWKAVYTGLNDAERGHALAAASSISAWQSETAVPEAQFGLTIFEFGEGGGPAQGCVAPRGELFIDLPVYPPVQ
jgi:hypothetical protein